MFIEKIKVENSDMKNALNATRVQLNELRKLVEEMEVNLIQNELKRQKKAITNLTALVRVNNIALTKQLVIAVSINVVGGF